MGNKMDSGFNIPPPYYLRDIRRQTNRHLKNIATMRQRREFSVRKTKKKEYTGGNTELTSESVKEYVIRNPDFLDELVNNHISQDRLRAWLHKRKGSDASNTQSKERDNDFAAELMERSFRHRQILLITRSRFLFPFAFKRDEVSDLMDRPNAERYHEDVESHLFPYTEVPPEDINKVVIHMVTMLFGKHAFPVPELFYFLSTLKSNYHNVEYHNYTHALSHAQSMYWILRRNPGVFSELEMKCLLISAIAHDVGHPGVNDSYLKNVGSGLERLYQTPILENHHTQICFLILQDINCNIFSNLDGEDYKTVLHNIQLCILSTSLNRYKIQSENMRHIIATDCSFDKANVREATMSVLMMTCDLCASWKCWDEHRNTVWSLYQEFFYQGEKQMAFNIESVPMMLRSNAENIPKYQVFFLKEVAIPVFQMAVKVFPNISAIMDSTNENLEVWNTCLADYT